MSYQNRESEVKNIVNVNVKKWNTHMLRMCAKKLTDLSVKQFKIERYIATLQNNHKKEREIMENMLIEKAKKCNENEWGLFYNELLKFESKRLLHPRTRYNLK